MNLFKTALPILFAAQSISAEDYSASAIRELIAKVDGYDAKIDSYDAKIDALKAEIATLKKSSSNSAPKSKNNVRRNQEEPPAMPEIPLDISDLTEGDMEDIISSVGAGEQLSGLLYGIIHTVNKLVGLAKCVSYEKYFDEDEDACIIGSEYVDNTYIFAHEDVIIDAPDDVYIEANDFLGIYADDNVEIGSEFLEMYSLAQASFSVFNYAFTWEYAKINGVMFPYNSEFDPFNPEAIDGDKPASNGEDDKSAKFKAKFDAMLEDKGYKAMFNTTSP